MESQHSFPPPSTTTPQRKEMRSDDCLRGWTARQPPGGRAGRTLPTLPTPSSSAAAPGPPPREDCTRGQGQGRTPPLPGWARRRLPCQTPGSPHSLTAAPHPTGQGTEQKQSTWQTARSADSTDALVRSGLTEGMSESQKGPGRSPELRA